ncbi:protein neuralized isoform X2 [Octopus bimaculoides]|uniref:protein neuralized isoform X2 n=1 Tax=Octopus bimaculoides TaxID=37653 RepID=UPI00071C50B1|nr:protein neuralized isoform X2 [Octopus bimaculoides]|eukprot:XP_014768780.1 PREDICTED: protein neuralized-like isoform X2 [Octopus bimaculoides]
MGIFDLESNICIDYKIFKSTSMQCMKDSSSSCCSRRRQSMDYSLYHSTSVPTSAASATSAPPLFDNPFSYSSCFAPDFFEKVNNGSYSDYPLTFHKVHGQNVVLNYDRTRASRGDSFCKGICFSNRPVAINERVYIRFVETCASWSGVLRFGFTNIDPATFSNAELPRYACPDLTSMSGNWAKALGERYAECTNLLFFYITRNGDVRYGVNGVEKGVFFSGVSTAGPLWALLDIYGNTVSVEFANPDASSLIPSPANISNLADLTSALQSMDLSHNNSTNNALTMASNHHNSSSTNANTTMVPIVRFHKNVDFTPVFFHDICGHNVCLDSEKTVAVRLPEEYCNGYVFTSRPISNEIIVIQILGIDRYYEGGLAFGFTTCDPANLSHEEFPDDADQFLDRREYWVVNKDVCRVSDIGDELSFYLTTEGEVRYARNTSKMTTLMHVDPTLPLWMFFDVYGNVQKIKILGSANPSQTRRLRPASACIANSSGSSGLTVALPPRVSTAPSTPTQYHANNTISNSNPNNNNNILSPSSPTAAMSTLVLRSLSMPPSSTSSSSSTSFHTSQTTANTSPVEGQSLMSTFSALPVSASNQNRGGQANPYLSFPSTFDSGLASINSSASDDSPIVDNESNECNVCYERPINSVLYTCGHMCMCFECALAVKQERGALCPICRQEIKDVIKTFRS